MHQLGAVSYSNLLLILILYQSEFFDIHAELGPSPSTKTKVWFFSILVRDVERFKILLLLFFSSVSWVLTLVVLIEYCCLYKFVVVISKNDHKIKSTLFNLKEAF